MKFPAGCFDGNCSALLGGEEDSCRTPTETV